VTISASYDINAIPWPHRPSKVSKSKAIRSLGCVLNVRGQPHRYTEDGRDGCNQYVYAALRVLVCQCWCHGGEWA